MQTKTTEAFISHKFQNSHHPTPTVLCNREDNKSVNIDHY